MINKKNRKLKHLLSFCCLLFFTHVVQGQYEYTIFEEEEGFEQKFGIKAVDTLSSGLIVYKRAKKEDVAFVGIVGEESPHKDGPPVYYAFEFNVGKNKNKLLLSDWAKSIDQLQENYLLIKDDGFKIYSINKQLFSDLETFNKPILYNNILIVKKFVPSNGAFSFYGNQEEPYVLYDLSNSLTKVYSDTFTFVAPYKEYLYLSNRSELGRSKLLNTQLESVLPKGMTPEGIYGDYVVVSNETLSYLGVINLKGEELIPLKYTNIDMGRYNEFVQYEGNGVGFGYRFRHQPITASNGDSTFLFNADFKLIYADKDFNYRMIELAEEDYYIQIEQNRNRGLINSEGKMIVPIMYRSFDFKENYIMVGGANYEDEEVFSYEGNKLFNGPYRHIYDIPGSDLVVLNASKGSGSTPAKVWLADTKTNTILTPESFNHYWGYSEGLIQFSNADHHYFYDTTGNLVFDLIADEVTDFIDGKAIVVKGKKQATINRKGEFLVKFHKE
ncbi:MAG: WG repeat-containing protein [Crocinitomicaceae bacterium]|nr:WG repeat-containing protein [Crocinitomicaceae bacterium]